jgi:16S rRNA (guanine527-N7)-methyltransferase
MNPLWTDLAARGNVTLTDAQHAALNRYLDLLLEANQTMNLTRITDRAQAELLHVADAMTILPFLPKNLHRIADLGSGGGVPGIPLAILRVDTRVTLIESTKKKAAFLRTAVEQLQLTNVTVLDERVEEVGCGERRGTFNVVTARAVGSLAWLVEWAMPLLQKGGNLLAMKGERAAAEVEQSKRACQRLNAGEAVIEPAPLPGHEGHVIVRVPKMGRTPDFYPRQPSIAKGEPL